MIQKKFSSGIFWTGILLFCVGILAFDLSKVERFFCNREQNECILQEKNLWESDFQTKEQIKLADIFSVDLMRHGRTSAHRRAFIPEIKIITKDKDIKVYGKMFNPFAGLFITYDAKRLNTYLHSSEQYLNIESCFLSVLFFPLICIILALFFITHTFIPSKVPNTKYNPQKNIDKERYRKRVLYTLVCIFSIILLIFINDLLIIFFVYKY